MIRVRIQVAAFLLLGAPTILRAQAPERAVLRGRVVTTENVAVRGAQVEITTDALPLKVTSDSTGAFRIAGIDPGVRDVQTRAIGFDPVGFTVTLGDRADVEVEIVMKSQTIAVMKETRVTERAGSSLMSGFYDRKARGHGIFIERAQIAVRQTPSAADLLRMVPGVNVRQRGGVGVDTRVEVDRCPTVAVFLDGVLARGRAGDVLKMIDPKTVEAMEIYTGLSQLPAEFRTPDNCAAIVMWTRIR